MSIKTKNTQNKTDKLGNASMHIGLILMTAAATLGMLELPEHHNSRVVVPNQPVFALSTQNTQQNNPLRREREETSPHYISYSVVERTAARTGKL